MSKKSKKRKFNFHFRRYKKKQGDSRKRHPKLIVDEYGNQYGFMGLTHNSQSGKRHNNIHLDENPEIDQFGNRLSDPAYLRKKIEYDKKRNFGIKEENYYLSKNDYKKIKKYVNKHKRKR